MYTHGIEMANDPIEGRMDPYLGIIDSLFIRI